MRPPVLAAAPGSGGHRWEPFGGNGSILAPTKRINIDTSILMYLF